MRCSRSSPTCCGRACSAGARQTTLAARGDSSCSRRYAQIMQARFAERVTVSWDVAPDVGDAEVPAMLLQPLLENAFKHGVEPSREPVAISIAARRGDEQLRVTVRNSGSRLAPNGRSGIGLANCRERIALLYGDAARLDVAEEGDGVVATLVQPWRSGGVMIRVLIVDDEAPARDKLRRWLSEPPDVEIVGECGDGLAAAEAIERLAPDVVFLDIQMPGLSGLEVAAQLEPATAPLIVFVTAFDEHAVKAFELDAVDYLLKPYDKDRLRKSLDRLRRRDPAVASAAVRAARRRTGTSERLLVPQGESLELLDAAAIHWLEADDNYVHVHTAQATFMLRRTLADLLAQLGERFARIHKSAAVNLAEVKALSPLFKGDHELELRSGATLRLSRRYKDELFARLG